MDNDKKAEVSLYNLRVTSAKDISKIIKENENIDFIVCSADTPMYYIQKYILENAIQFNIPCAFGGVGITNGTIGPILNNNISKNNYITKLNYIIESVEYTKACKGSIGITNSLISCYMAKDIIVKKKYIL